MEILKIDTERRRLGDYGERQAAKLLRKKGYRILERGYVMLEHEIDIIAESKSVIVFVEVKTRKVESADPREPRPASAVTPKKQRGIISAAKGYLATHRPQKHVRFDIIEVYVSGTGFFGRRAELKHIENAFDKNTAFKPKFAN